MRTDVNRRLRPCFCFSIRVGLDSRKTVFVICSLTLLTHGGLLVRSTAHGACTEDRLVSVCSLPCSEGGNACIREL